MIRGLEPEDLCYCPEYKLKPQDATTLSRNRTSSPPVLAGEKATCRSKALRRQLYLHKGAWSGSLKEFSWRISVIRVKLTCYCLSTELGRIRLEVKHCILRRERAVEAHRRIGLGLSGQAVAYDSNAGSGQELPLS
ncbi:hypothetical protein WG66_003374 [Moniliophthora roreri]|nr:hypothetical protein WG66_003374 [Moniliophthora roreri]